MLDWKVIEWPSWGTWTITPASGLNLFPSDGEFTVQISVVAPDEQNQEYIGAVKIVNKDDSSDYCIIQVSLVTPKNKTVFDFFQSRFPNAFPILGELLEWDKWSEDISFFIEEELEEIDFALLEFLLYFEIFLDHSVLYILIGYLH